MKRRDFIQIGSLSAKKNVKKIIPNPIEQPEQVLQTTEITSTLTPYTGAWGKAEATHLLRRVHFGAPVSKVAYLQNLTFAQAIDAVMQPQAMPTDLPLNGYNSFLDMGVPPDPFVPLGSTWVGAAFANDYEWHRNISHLSWWFRQIISDTSVSVHHKMTFFWFNHIPVQGGEVFISNAYHKYMMLLRANALGNFKTMTKAIALSPAMLKYLNGQYNNVSAPDENFARELLELFVIGKGADGSGAGYLESDVVAAAKVLTGWRYVSENDLTTYFHAPWHNTTNKQFSAFFNNTAITGRTGAAAGDTELNDLLTMLFAQPEAAKFVCRKLYRFFVYDNITPQTETNIILPLADVFRNSGYDIALTLRTLLKSEHFFDTAFRSAMIKSPLDHVLGMMRELNIALPAANDYSNSYRIGLHLWYYMMTEQMNVPDPPNVAGWQAWYQLGVFDRFWITTDTMPQRALWSDSSVFSWFTTPGGFKLGCDIIAYTQSLTTPENAAALVNQLIDRFYSMPVSQNVRTRATEQLITPLTDAAYWTQAWNEYLADPTNQNLIDGIKWRLGKCYQVIVQNEEYHLM
jgi:Protein of unknown function (DUF1800)